MAFTHTYTNKHTQDFLLQIDYESQIRTVNVIAAHFKMKLVLRSPFEYIY